MWYCYISHKECLGMKVIGLDMHCWTFNWTFNAKGGKKLEKKFITDKNSTKQKHAQLTNWTIFDEFAYSGIHSIQACIRRIYLNLNPTYRILIHPLFSIRMYKQTTIAKRIFRPVEEGTKADRNTLNNAQNNEVHCITFTSGTNALKFA